MSPAKFLLTMLFVLAAVAASRVFAVDDAMMTLQSIRGAGWQATGLRARLELGATLGAELGIDRVRVGNLPDEMREVRVFCPDLRMTDELIACARAQVQGVLPYLGRQSFTASATYQRRSGVLELRTSGLKIAKGTARISLRSDAQQWKLDVDLREAAVADALSLARRFNTALDFSGKGLMDAKLTAEGRAAQVTRLAWQWSAQSLTVNNPAGTLASEALRTSSRGTAARDAQGWNFVAEFAAPAGQGYAEPIFVDFGKHGLVAQAQGHWNGTRLELKRFEFAQQDLARVRGRGTFAVGENFSIVDLIADIDTLQFPGTYATYLQPFLSNDALKTLQTSGTLKGRVEILDNAPTAVNLELRALSGRSGTQFALENINGAVHWNRSAVDENAVPQSQVRWSSGNVLGLQLGATELALQTWGTTLRLAEPARIPIFNGALAIDALRIRKLGTPQVAFMLDANVEPVSVAQLSRAFGWPEFGGEISGRITKLRLEDGVLTLGTTLIAQVFDGEVAIGNMRLENALGAWPRFQADIALRNLDLQLATQAFSFGLITGRLSGDIDKLMLFNWEPVSFDAKLYTPANDRSRHRISQRAVQNIGSLGGSGAGVAAALQSGLLKFFDDFNYDRLGISCRLENEICRMSGIARAGNGYYLVKGKGLPRIDVIGNAERVDWPRMVAQLKAVTESSGPVVR